MLPLPEMKFDPALNHPSQDFNHKHTSQPMALAQSRACLLFWPSKIVLLLLFEYIEGRKQRTREPLKPLLARAECEGPVAGRNSCSTRSRCQIFKEML